MEKMTEYPRNIQWFYEKEVSDVVNESLAACTEQIQR